MSNFGNNSFKLIMNNSNESYEKSTLESEETVPMINKEKNNLSFISIEEAYMIFKKRYSNILPTIDSEQEIHYYILDIMKDDDEMDLNEKYICSFYLAMNKHLLSKETIKDLLDEEFHLTLMKWLRREKHYIKDEINEIQDSNSNTNSNSNNYNFNIYIGLLINIISLFEILPIKSSDLAEFNFYEKLFKLNKFVKFKLSVFIKTSLSFLTEKIENLLQKWKTQEECYNLSKNILLFNISKEKNLLGKKTKRNNNTEKDKEETEADSEEGASSVKRNSGNSNKPKLGGLFVKNKNNLNKNKKVNFDLQNNQIIFFDKEDKVSSLLKNSSLSF